MFFSKNILGATTVGQMTAQKHYHEIQYLDLAYKEFQTKMAFFKAKIYFKNIQLSVINIRNSF
jgi:hypothetical protein